MPDQRAQRDRERQAQAGLLDADPLGPDGPLERQQLVQSFTSLISGRQPRDTRGGPTIRAITRVWHGFHNARWVDPPARRPKEPPSPKTVP